MGADKATIRVDGTTQAVRLGALLIELVAPAVEVGPGSSGLPHLEEEPRSSGPLVAIAAGADWLLRHGHAGPAVVLACDLPLVTSAVIDLLASYAGEGTVMPVVAGQEQPLCARWSGADLRATAAAVVAGERSLRRLPKRSSAVLLGESEWGAVAGPDAFADVDTPEDLAALGFGGRVELPDGN